MFNTQKRSVVAERFIVRLKSNSCKYMTSVAHTVNKYNNTYHSTIKLKSVDVSQANILTLTKHKYICASYFPHWFEELFVIKKVENTVP